MTLVAKGLNNRLI